MRGKDYLFIPRKGQITLSFLLIFFILFSVFAVGIFASREMWASAKFKGAVDAAALSAGADMSRGADLFITTTGIRLALFGISMLLYIISIPCPEVLPAAQKINDLSKNVSGKLGKFSQYIPAAYTLKAEIDAYEVFKKDFSVSAQGISKWSPNDYGIVVIPNYSINGLVDLFTNSNGKITTDTLKSKFLPTSLKDSMNMLKDGVSVFGYRKLSYMEQIRKNLGITEDYDYSKLGAAALLEKWLNEHEYIVSSVRVRKRAKGGVDISDALKISEFLKKNWEGIVNKASSVPKEKTLKDIIDEILTKASEVVDSTNNIATYAIYVDGQDCAASYPREAVCKANEISDEIDELGKDGFSCDNCSHKIHGWINFCRQEFASRRLSGKVNGHLFYKDISKIEDQSVELKSAIYEYRNSLNAWENSNGEQNLNKSGLEELKDIIHSIEGSTNNSINILNKELGSLPNTCTCKKTVSGHDKDGNPIPPITRKIDFNPTKEPMRSVLKRLEKIENACKDALNEMDNANKKSDDLMKNGFREAEDNLGSSFAGLFKSMQSIKGVATAFEGFPGGNLVACLAAPDKYKCRKDCSRCHIPFVGKIICAANEDIKLTEGLFSGKKIEFASYYSAELEAPPFIKDFTANVINSENKSVGNLINNVSDKSFDQISDAVSSAVAGSLSFTEPSESLNVSSLGLSIGGSILSGLFTGGATVIIAAMLNTLAKEVVEPMINNMIKTQLLPTLKKQVESWADEISNTDIGKSISAALGKFIDIFNIISTTKLRLLGNNSQINSSSKLSLRFLLSRAAPDIKMRRLNHEKSYSFS